MARTLNRATRSIPAMPIADSSPPIVVGIRQTSRATSATVSTVVPAYSPNGRKVTVAIRNTIERPESRIARAISLGVRWRFAPSTSAIIRSRKVSPGSVVTRMTRWSLTSVVPPVTELRMSVPGSSRTGADSPVIAASLTKPMPSITSPSPAIVSPSPTTMTSPLRSSPEPTSSTVPSGRRRWAVVSERVLRSVAAWARPRASATASAYVAKRTVNQSQIPIWNWKPAPAWAAGSAGWRPVTFASQISVTRTAVISTTNITGLLISSRGSSLRKACGTADRSRSGSRIPRGLGGSAPAGFWPPSVTNRWKRRVPRPRSIDMRERVRLMESGHLSGVLEELLDDGAEGERGKEREGPDDDHDADQQDGPQDAGRWERPERGRDAALGCHRPGEGEDRDDHPVAADQHRQAAGDVVEGRVPAESSERGAVVAGLAGEGVEDLAEAMGPGVERAGKARLRDRRECREAQDAGAQDERHEHRHLDLEGLDLLAEVLRRPADHQARNEHGEDGADDEHPVHPGTDAAGCDLAELHVEERDEAGDR